jgi:hypothetical protein
VTMWSDKGGQWNGWGSDWDAACACQKAPEAATNACVEDAVLFEFKCYEFSYPTTFTPSQCQTHCADKGAAMACVPDLTTQNFLYNRRQANLYIGLTKQADGTTTE